jgi:hypothetical protein
MPGVSADRPDGGAEATLAIGAGETTDATGLPHIMQVSAPWTRSPLHLTQCIAMTLFAPFTIFAPDWKF